MKDDKTGNPCFFQASWLRLHLGKRLTSSLPGHIAHHELAPPGSGRQEDTAMPAKTARESAVLIALYPSADSWALCLIKRPEYDGVHSGQIAFPGGGKEKADKTIIETALREAHEEVNINPLSTEILGTLSPIYVPPSNYNITPVVGMLRKKPHFIPDPTEVAEIREIPLNELIGKNIPFTRKTFFHGTEKEISAPCFSIKETVIWGATAMILNEFIQIMKTIVHS
ncbi:MAG: CoA pyrophosphatase [Bacteroidales bacterium]